MTQQRCSHCGGMDVAPGAACRLCGRERGVAVPRCPECGCCQPPGCTGHAGMARGTGPGDWYCRGCPASEGAKGAVLAERRKYEARKRAGTLTYQRRARAV